MSAGQDAQDARAAALAAEQAQQAKRVRDAQLALNDSTGAACCVGVDAGCLSLQACSISAINGTSVGVTGASARVLMDQVRPVTP
jgi:hypothetical protein